MTLDQKITDLEGVIDDFMAAYELIVNGRIGFNTIADLLADTVLTSQLSDGERVFILEHGGFDLLKVADGLVHYTVAGTGAKFRLRMDVASPLMLGAAGDGVSNDAAALDLLLGSDATFIDLLGRDYLYVGTFVADRPIRHGRVIDDAETHDYFGLTSVPIATTAEALAGAPDTALITMASLRTLLQRNLTQTAFTGTAYYAAATSHEIAELRTTITTRSDNSRVRVSGTVSYERNNSAVFTITRNGTPIMINTEAGGSRLVGSFPALSDLEDLTSCCVLSFEFLDDVGLAGNYEYRIEVAGQNAEALSINRTVSDTDAANNERCASIVLLEEIEDWS